MVGNSLFQVEHKKLATFKFNMNYLIVKINNHSWFYPLLTKYSFFNSDFVLEQIGRLVDLMTVWLVFSYRKDTEPFIPCFHVLTSNTSFERLLSVTFQTSFLG